MANVKTVNGLLRANVKSRNGLASANIKTINGVDAVLAGGPFGGLVDTTNLVEWWPLSESTGDRVGVHAGINLGEINSVTGGNDGVAYSQFTAANSEYLTRGDLAAISHADVDFAWCAWVYLDTKSAIRYFIMKGSSSATFETAEVMLLYNSSSDRFEWQIYGAASGVNVAANNLGSPSTGTWYFIVCEHDATGNTASIQVNNGTANSSSYSAGCKDTATGLFFGSTGVPAQFHDGRMRRMGFWKNGRPSAGEKTALYNAGAGLDY